MRRDRGDLVEPSLSPWSSRECPEIAVVSRWVRRAQAERVAGAVSGVLALHAVTGGARLRVAGGDCADGPMLVQVNLRVGDTPVRVQVLTRDRGDVLAVVERLDRQIRCVSGPWRPLPWPDRSRRVLIGPDAGAIVRRKACVLQRVIPAQAVAVMDAIDYDVHLFTDAETGQDAVVYRAGPPGLRLAFQCSMRHPAVTSDTAAAPRLRLAVHPHHTPILAEADAVHRLCDDAVPFVLFTDKATGRGRLLYCRYDGNLGLITPIGNQPGRGLNVEQPE